MSFLTLVAVARSVTQSATPFGLSDDGFVAIVLGILGVVGVLVGAPLAAWIQVRGLRRDTAEARDDSKNARMLAESLAESVGEKNGHGSVQDATGILLTELRETRADVKALGETQRSMQRTQHAMQTSLDSFVDAASLVTDRLKAHDREHGEHRRTDRAHEERLDALEATRSDQNTTPGEAP